MRFSVLNVFSTKSVSDQKKVAFPTWQKMFRDSNSKFSFSSFFSIPEGKCLKLKKKKISSYHRTRADFLISKKKKNKKNKPLLYTCSHNYAESNGKCKKKKKKANVRQRKVNTVHLPRTSSTIRFPVFPVLIIEAISILELAVVKKL